jgi:hypothetical protein
VSRSGIECAQAPTSWRLGSQPHDVLAREHASPQHVMVIPHDRYLLNIDMQEPGIVSRLVKFV